MNPLSTYTDSPDTPYLAVAYGLVAVFVVIAYVVTALLTAPFFAKIGEPKWKAWVPVYVNWVFLERAGFSGALSLLALASSVPYVGFVAGIVLTVFLIRAAFRYGDDFGKPGVEFAVLYAFLPVVWFGILGLGRAVYEPGRSQTPPTASFGDSSPYGPRPTA